MKTMTCQQLGGACNKKLHAESWDEMQQKSKEHAMEMLEQGDEAHLRAMKKMKELMSKPEAMVEWFEKKKKEFEEISED